MKYYTKEWYELMQRQHYTSGLQKIPDKTYSDQEIQSFYDADLAAEVAHDEMLYNTPPDYDLYESLLDPARFQPHNFLFVNEETGDFDITIPTKGTVTQVVVKSGEHEYTVWPQEGEGLVDVTFTTDPKDYVQMQFVPIAEGEKQDG